jgi:hypothetical protein
MAKVAARSDVPVQVTPDALGVVEIPPPRRHKPLLGLLAQPPLLLVKAVHVPMSTRSCARSSRCALSSQHCRSP